MKRASVDTIGIIHGKLAKVFIEALDAIDPAEKGAAAVLNVIRQFVKDNGVDALPAPGSPLGNLADKVAEFPFDPSAEMTVN